VTADTIYALSSGSPPAAIAIVRISGPHADTALEALTGRLPDPRVATLKAVRDPITGELLDRALALRFPGPASATGEDIVELHLHGGRSVVAAVLDVLSRAEGLRPALPGEFTRRAFENGRMDLTEAEGLADLLSAETQSQRRAALQLVEGQLSGKIREWERILLSLSAGVEAVLDFSDEDDVSDELPSEWHALLQRLIAEITSTLDAPPAERLRDGVRVVIAGPPNAGKSTLLNRLAGRRAAITSAIPGTTRDVIEAPTAIGGTPFLLVDTAGLRESHDEIEAAGVELARETLGAADLVLWLGAPSDCPCPDRAILVSAKADLRPPGKRTDADVHVSAQSGEGMDKLITLLGERAHTLLPAISDVAMNSRHRGALCECVDHLRAATEHHDLLVISEALRLARVSLDRVAGRAGVEDMLDRLFGSFCIGK
jgi:tRNA modification GTPase